MLFPITTLKCRNTIMYSQLRALRFRRDDALAPPPHPNIKNASFLPWLSLMGPINIESHKSQYFIHKQYNDNRKKERLSLAIYLLSNSQTFCIDLLSPPCLSFSINKTKSLSILNWKSFLTICPFLRDLLSVQPCHRYTYIREKICNS